MLIVWNVVNWMFIIPRIKKIFPPLYGFMAVVWKEEVNLFPGVTHFTIRKERGLPNGIPIIDEFAPVNKARKDTAPVVLITGDKNLEMADRYEENALLASVLKNIGNRKVSLYELQGFDHGQVLGPACYLIVNYVKRFK